MTKLKIQLYSGLHLELTKVFPRILPLAKYLFLVGNIGKLSNTLLFNFLDYCTSRWEKIFYIPGNHEFYSGKKNYDTLNFEYELRIKERYKNIYYLNKNFVSLNDEIDIYGSVFWTNPPDDIYINDYREIKQFSETKKYNIPINSIFMKKMSDNEVKSISTYLNNTKKKVIIITHFPPIEDCIINEKCLNYKIYFAWNNILKELDLKNIILWISGHTQLSYDKIYNNSIRLISNQSDNSESNKYFNQRGYFEITY